MMATSASVRSMVYRAKAEVLTLYSCDPDTGLSEDDVVNRRCSSGYARRSSRSAAAAASASVSVSFARAWSPS